MEQCTATGDIKAICDADSPLNSQLWHRLITQICRLKEHMLEETERMRLTEEDINILTKMLQRCKHCIDQSNTDMTEVVNYVTESYRTLRNACVQCKRNQDIVYTQECLFTLTSDLIHTLISLSETNDNDSYIIALRCIIQFLGNCASGHKENQLLIWRTFVNVFREMLSLSDDKLITYICMVSHTCLSSNLDNSEIWSSQDTVQVVTNIIMYTTEQDCEWGMFLIESLCKVDNGFSLVFPSLKDIQKLLVLEIMLDLVKNVKEELVKNVKEEHQLSHSNVQYITEDVKTQSYKILSLLEKHENQNPVVIVKEIEILGIATSHHTLYPSINSDKDLLTCIIYLLDAIHKIGKKGNNEFSSVDKATNTVHIDKDHAGYGLKRDLIGLIGNMAYKSRTNQDLIRDMNCIPLVLEQTNIDGRNPYITQWSVLAIHNICEDNNDNKAVLAGLKFDGLADDADVLRKYGIEAEVKDGQIVVKPPSDNT